MTSRSANPREASSMPLRPHGGRFWARGCPHEAPQLCSLSWQSPRPPHSRGRNPVSSSALSLLEVLLGTPKQAVVHSFSNK